MFEVIVTQTGLSLHGLDHYDFDPASTNPFAQTKTPMSEQHGGMDSRNAIGYNIPHGEQAATDANNAPWVEFPSYSMPYMTDAVVSYDTMMRDEDPERWINELLDENVLGMNSMPL